MKEELLKKWLENDLGSEELKQFQALEDYEALMRLDKNLKKFQAPTFNQTKAFEEISKSISAKTLPKKKTTWLKPVLRIAALLAILFSVYYFSTNINNTNTHYATVKAEKKRIELPDHSQVTLNAISELSYNSKKWHTNRSLTLNGEAYFKVTKGSQFQVETNAGTITVLGTQFLVESREHFFEVVCYEGSVQVTTKNRTAILKPGDQFLILNNKYVAQEKELQTEPAWLHNESQFNSIPYKYVLKELERQYQVTINAKNIDTNILFTGKFVHNNLDLALKTITIPLNLEFTKKNSVVILHEK